MASRYKERSSCYLSHWIYTGSKNTGSSSRAVRDQWASTDNPSLPVKQSAGERLSYKWPKQAEMPCQWQLVSHAVPETRVLHDFMVQISLTNSVHFWYGREERKGPSVQEAFQLHATAVGCTCQSGAKRTACRSVIPAARLSLVLSLPFTFYTYSMWSALCSCLRESEARVSYWKVHVLDPVSLLFLHLFRAEGNSRSETISLHVGC